MIRKIQWLLLLLIIGVIAAQYFYKSSLTQPLMITQATSTYIVKSGTSIRGVSRELHSQGLMSQPAWVFELYARLNGKASHIKAGEYQLAQGTTLPELLDQLVKGKVIQHAFTIIEGYTIKQLLSEIAENTHLKHVLNTGNEQALLTALNIKEPHAEGLFLPETYHFPAGTTDIAFLQRAHEKLMTALDTAWQQRAKNLPYKSAYEALIMASIIEKETASAEERPDIAGVFVRRLEKGMRLQTDPTVIYGLGDTFDGNLHRRDLKTDTPYNTYTRFGLPPTPICLPSIESIKAALHPAAGNSLYFVATGVDGRHVFSSNLKDHNKAVRRYQLKH